MNFQEANKVVHKVEDQWHYLPLVAAGFTPVTKEDIGFVRRYVYEKGGYQISCHTGSSSDYWVDLQTKKTGYWRELELHLKGLA